MESYDKVFVCGNIASGKSPLAAVIKKPADHKFDTSKCVTVEPLTAGITFTSHEIGNVILYDLAGAPISSKESIFSSQY